MTSTSGSPPPPPIVPPCESNACTFGNEDGTGCSCATPTDAFRGGSIATFIFFIVITLLLLASLCVNSVMRVTAAGADKTIHIRLHRASYSNGGVTMKANLKDATCNNANSVKGGAAVLYLSFFASLFTTIALGVEVFKRFTVRCVTMVLIGVTAALTVLVNIAYGYLMMELDEADRSCWMLPPGGPLDFEVEGTWKCAGIALLFVVVAIFIYISNRYCRCCCARRRGRAAPHRTGCRMFQLHHQQLHSPGYHHHHCPAVSGMMYPPTTLQQQQQQQFQQQHQQRYLFTTYPPHAHGHAHAHPHHHVAVFVPQPGAAPTAVAYIYPPTSMGGAFVPAPGTASPVQQGVVIGSPTMPPPPLASQPSSLFASAAGGNHAGHSSASYSDTAAGATTAESDTPKSFH